MADPLEDFDRRDAEFARREAKAPVCECCDYPILDNFFYKIMGKRICTACVQDALTWIEEDE